MLKQRIHPANKTRSNRVSSSGIGSRILSCAALLLLGLASNACQPPSVRTRHAVEPGLISQDGYTTPLRGAQMQIGGYSVNRLQASAASRQWPLLDSRTLSHRYGFEISTAENTQGVQCVLITVTGDEARERVSLDCTVGGDSSWRIQLSGRRGLDGALSGGNRDYEVRSAASAWHDGDRQGRSRADYVIVASETEVAGVVLGGGPGSWVAPELNDSDRGAVAATVVALLVGHELGRGGR